jgi:hypothetical protein
MCWKEKIQWQCYPRASERGTTKLRNENETKNEETKRNEISQNEAKYIKQSINDPKTINEGVKINEILSG